MEENILRTSDGGSLALYSYGDSQAPGHRRILVVGGAFLTALIYRPFAAALGARLGENWTVDVYDRRGRGNSTEQPADYSMDTEIADVALMLEHTGAQSLFGHSLGGAVVLNAVRRFLDPGAKGDGPVPARLAVYDPAINLDASIDTTWLNAFSDDVAAGRNSRALARMQRGMKFSPTLGKIPEPILAALLAGTSRTKAGKLARTMLPSGVGELKAALEESQPASGFSILPENTRFMAGSKSAKYFRSTARKLHEVVPGSTYLETPKGMHGSVPAAFTSLLDDIGDYFTRP
ncbi:alpha/beta hydrolase [Arthrobacter sp. UCD-GKA]|uniref:alpha/beta fold hydrolase n=1 Tax=Arthrobacter sp. UCD-GKA TaxID=1913576 RepID=UPI0008DCF67E|nr:alpha/beta hydrolase [Arthrobacter sp. UCD-GKA]OIH84418.1 alpha/beta hydrolase [Arthrobacter sp. UCD-GKA]